jgi:hypothetical protein
MLRKILPALSVLLLATTLGGCFQFGSAASPGLPARLPRECQRLLVKVPDPGAEEGRPMLDIAAGYRGAWLKANHRLGAGRACEDHQADTVDRGAR